MTSAPETPAPSAPPRRRVPRVAILVVVVTLALMSWFLYKRWIGGVSTDDAYVRADTTQVAAEVTGRVVQVLVRENQPVKAGDLLVKIDDSDFKLRVTQAEANLAAAHADAIRARKSVVASRSDLKTGEARLADAKREDDLQSRLVEGGAAGKAVADRARTVQVVAAQTLKTAQAGVEANAAAADGAESREIAAQAALDLAKRDLALTEVRAPCDGFAAKVDAQVGEFVQRGTPLLAVVPTQVYVVAAFKETDIEHIAVGDAVDIEFDAFPDFPVHGKVESLGVGTGASFSLLPADNASGNFIKVVQRVPIRIALDQVDAGGHALSIGLSAYVKIPRKPGT